MAHIFQVTRYRYNNKEWSYAGLREHLTDRIGSEIINTTPLGPGARIAVHQAILENEDGLLEILLRLRELREAASEDA